MSTRFRERQFFSKVLFFSLPSFVSDLHVYLGDAQVPFVDWLDLSKLRLCPRVERGASFFGFKNLV